MIIAKNICKRKIIVNGKKVLPGKNVTVDNLDCIKSKVLNNFLEVVEEKKSLEKKKVAKEQPKKEIPVMKTEDKNEEDE